MPPKGDKFDNRTMSRSTNDLDTNFIRDADGLLLLLESPKWRLERGKAYPVTLIAGSRSIEAVLGLNQGSEHTLPDRLLNERMELEHLRSSRRGCDVKSTVGRKHSSFVARLEACIEKNSRQNSDTNLFVAPNRKP